MTSAWLLAFLGALFVVVMAWPYRPPRYRDAPMFGGEFFLRGAERKRRRDWNIK